MSQGFAQGPYVVARVGFEPAIFRKQGTELTTEPPRPTNQQNLMKTEPATHNIHHYSISQTGRDLIAEW